jgi:PAS domain S-box-containing protein
MKGVGYLEASFVNGQPTGPEPRFGALATSAPVGIYEIDGSGDCLFVNEHWCELAGVDAEVAMGRGWEAAIHPADLETVIAEWTAASDQGREFALEYRFRRPNGDVVWVAGRAVAVRDRDDDVLAYLGTVVDITDRKRFEAELEASEERYRTTLDAMEDVVFRTDLGARWTFLNFAWSAHTGRSVSDALGESLLETIAEEDRSAVNRALESLLDDSREAVRCLHRYHGADGELRWADTTVRRMIDARGSAIGLAGTMSDVTERLAGERAARELAAIVESSADAIVGKDLEGVVRTWNPGAERIYGYGADEMIGRSSDVLVPPGHRSELPEILGRIRAGERIESLETIRMRKDRRRIHVAMTISPIRDDEGNVVGTSTIARDITAQKAADRRLAESSRHFELTHDLIATCGFDGYFRQLNGAWEPTLGWSHADLLPNPFIAIVHPDDRDAVADRFARLAEEGESIQFRIRLVTKDGGWRWTEWSAMPEVADGLVYASGRDITERVEAELALKRERQQLADAQEIASIGSFEVDPATDGRHWSAQQFRNLGFDPDGPVPSLEQIRERVHPDDRAEFDAQLADAYAGAGETTFEYRIVTPSGETRTIEAQARMVVGAGGSRRLMGVSRDVTAERDAERLKEEFFGLISHELRTPLTSIIGYAELLAEIEAQNLSGQGRRFLEVIERNSRRELSLVADLLLLTRITAGTFEIELGRADIGEIAAATVEAARPSAEQAGIELALEAPEGLVAEGDPHRLRQVLENLVSNAVKFTPEGGRVEVEVAPAGEGVAFRVSDDGVGVAAADLGRLFDRLYRAEDAERRHIQGTGLGLTIVKAIVDAHEATIEVESEPGEGTTFRITLPKRAPAIAPGDRSARDRRPAHGRQAGGRVSERG